MKINLKPMETNLSLDAQDACTGLLRSKTDNDGVAIVHAWLPRFNAGRAAVLIRATKDDYAAELRRVIHH